MNVHHHRRSSLASPAATARRISSIRRDVRTMRACVIFLVVVIGVAASVAAADILAPTAIAVVLALVLAPVARAMERRGVPESVATVLAVVVTVSLLAGIAAGLAPAANAWIARLPEIAKNVERKLEPIMQKISALEASSHFGQAAAGAAPAGPSVPVDGIVVSAVTAAPGIIAKIIYVTILTIFLLATRRRYTEQLILLPARFENRLRMSRICRDVRLKVSSYLFTLTMINVGLVVVTTGLFYLAGISDALLWGIFFGLMNFIPVIGPTTVILTAAIVGFATGDTVMEALLPPVILLAIDSVEANFIQPYLVGKRIVISPVAIFIMVVLLVWMWGAPAAITAVPMLIIFHTISLHVPSLRPVALMLARETDHGDGTHGLGLRARRQKLRAARKLQPAMDA